MDEAPEKSSEERRVQAVAERDDKRSEVQKRRSPGEGGVYKRADGRWVGVLDLGWVGGKRKRKSFYGKTKSEARTKLNAAKAKLASGERVNFERQTVEQFLIRWLENEVKPNKAPKTYESYESTVRVHIVPEIGRIQLQKLTAPDVQALMRSRERGGSSPRTVSYVRTVLRIALDRAVKWQMVPRNVADLVDPPIQVKTEITPWSRDEALRFLEVARSHRLGTLFTVVMALGLRKGEALGLRWDDIDINRKVLTIRHQLQRSKAHGLNLKVPKTERSRRTLVIPDSIITSVDAHRANQELERLAAGDRWKETGLVFTTTIGTPIEPSNVNKLLNKLMEQAGLRHQRFHDQRHWCATLLLAQKVPLRTVMDILGHTQMATTTDLYGHVLEEEQRKAAEMMGAFFDRPEEGGEA